MPDQLHLSGPVRRVYDQKVLAGEIVAEPEQIALAAKLDQLITDISAKRLSSKSSSLGWLFGKKTEENPTKDGLYIWGDVGRGKTYLMDIFFSICDFLPKRRVHFNDFMQETHQHIHDHRQNYKSGNTKQKDPIPPVARLLASKSKVLCFDEFHVSDITDAMLLGRLFKVLFDEGTIIVATSNVQPANLYRDGFNRQLFTPFIELLQVKLNVHEMLAGSDYRLLKLGAENMYSWPLNERAKHAMQDTWNLLTENAKPEEQTIELKGRQLVVPQAARSVARFHFDQLCREARSAEDYLAIARQYKTIMIDDVPVLSAEERNEAKRFIMLIDVLYDNKCRVIISAEGPPDTIYQVASGKEAFEFARTVSRLIELQSQDYNEAGDGVK
ncbi:MAG: AFG1 family ATPase [Rhizobiaceae bacterium]|nr:AFG1 family ATPase [Rhizobiaceae bacterium]